MSNKWRIVKNLKGDACGPIEVEAHQLREGIAGNHESPQPANNMSRPKFIVEYLPNTNSILLYNLRARVSTPVNQPVLFFPERRAPQFENNCLETQQPARNGMACTSPIHSKVSGFQY
jgi:hypothetical protein